MDRLPVIPRLYADCLGDRCVCDVPDAEPGLVHGDHGLPGRLCGGDAGGTAIRAQHQEQVHVWHVVPHGGHVDDRRHVQDGLLHNARGAHAVLDLWSHAVLPGLCDPVPSVAVPEEHAAPAVGQCAWGLAVCPLRRAARRGGGPT